jgi:YwiC-like protein
MAAQTFSTEQTDDKLSFAQASEQTSSANRLAPARVGRSKSPGVRLRPVALPVEHGGWGLVLEPLVLGLCLAPSVPGIFLSVAALAAFLARHPLKIVAGDRRRKRPFPRASVAERFALAYAAISLLSFILALKTSPTVCLWPLLMAAPFALGQLVYDAMGRSRELWPELSGATAMAAVAAAITLASGWHITDALALWLLLVTVRVIPSILYVRARLQKNHGAQPAIAYVLGAHLTGCAIVLVLAWLGLAPALAVVVALLLMLRAAFARSPFCPQVSARQVGFSAIGFGLATVLALVLGYALRL